MTVNPGKNFLDQRGFPTPSDIPESEVCRRFFVPNSPEWMGLLMGAVELLTQEWAYYSWGDVTPVEAAEQWTRIVWDAYEESFVDNCSDQVPAPFWDDGDGADADDTAPENDQPWYGILLSEETWQEQIEDWFLAAFVAMAATPAAAITFLTIAPKFRLAWKTANWGAIVKIFLDQTEIATVDTYSATPGIVTYDVFVPTGMGMANGAHELWIMHSGEHNEAATPDENGNFTIQVIRKQLSEDEFGVATELRQSENDPCVLEYSIDGGENWLTAFDYGLCTAPNQAPPDTIIVNPAAPDETFISQDGDTDEQKQARADGLCYASGYVVATLTDAAYKICNGEATAFNFGGIVLGLVTAILVRVTIISAGSLTAIAMLVMAALFEIIGQVQSLTCNLYLDSDIRDALTCIVYGNLMNQPVTLAGFQHAFDHNPDCTDSDAGDVADVLASMLQSPAYKQRLFNAFLNVLGEAQSAALQGATITSCICVPETWSSLLNFAADGMGIVEIITVLNEPALYVAGCGVKQNGNSGSWTDCAFSNGAYGVAVEFTFFVPAGTTVNEIRMFATAQSSPDSLTIVDGSCANWSTGLHPYAFRVFGTPLGEGTHTIKIYCNTNIASDPVLIAVGLTGDGQSPFNDGCDDIANVPSYSC